MVLVRGYSAASDASCSATNSGAAADATDAAADSVAVAAEIIDAADVADASSSVGGGGCDAFNDTIDDVAGGDTDCGTI